MTKRAPKVEVVRHDLHPLVMGLARNIQDGAERNEVKLREQEARWKYEQVECLWYMATQLDSGQWRGAVISGLPPLMRTCNVTSQEERHLEADLRMQFAKECQALRLCRTWDDSRARAARLKLLCSERKAL